MNQVVINQNASMQRKSECWCMSVWMFQRKQAKLVVLPLIVNFSCVVVMMMWGVAIAGRSEPKLT